MDKIAPKDQLPRLVGMLRVLVVRTEGAGSLGRAVDWYREDPLELTCLVFRQLLLRTWEIAAREGNRVVLFEIYTMAASVSSRMNQYIWYPGMSDVPSWVCSWLLAAAWVSSVRWSQSP